MTLIHGLEIDGPPASPELAMAGRPGQIPAQLVGHTLFYFTQEGELIFDPMAGGGVVPDTCLAFNRRCWPFDLVDRPETRPEIEPHQWNPERLVWPVKGKERPDLIFFDPPYFKKKETHYPQESISTLSRKEYLEFFKALFPLFREHAKAYGRIAFLNADWREFQGVSAREEDPEQSIFLSDYVELLKASGWQLTHIVDCPMSLRAGGHTAISSKHGEPDAQEPNPGSRSTLAYCRNKEMIESPSWARGAVSYDAIVALRKQEQFIKKILEEIMRSSVKP